MGFRFRKSIKILPGVRVNIGKKGLSSMSLGPRGTSMSIGSQGKHANIGITGTGISFRHKLGSKQEEREQQRLLKEEKMLEKLERRKKALSKITLGLNENGSINIVNAFSEPLSRADVKIVWEQQADTIYEWLEDKADEINGDVELLEKIYQDTPEPNTQPAYVMKTFNKSKPGLATIKEKPQKENPPSLGFFTGLFKSKRLEHEKKVNEYENEYKVKLLKWEKEIAKKSKEYEEELKQWENEKEEFEKKEKYYQENFHDLIHADIEFMEACILDIFDSLSWIRETLVSYEIDGEGHTIWIDVDLPEIEDLPQKVATISSTGKKLNVKDKSKKQLQLEYAQHIHGIAFRLSGTAFAALPKVENITISGYSQRLDKSTGRINDDYLFSFKIDRNRFNEIDFNSLNMVDPIEALNAFDNIRKMTATGIFRTIEPYRYIQS